MGRNSQCFQELSIGIENLPRGQYVGDPHWEAIEQFPKHSRIVIAGRDIDIGTRGSG